MRLRNNSDRIINLSRGVSLRPRQEVVLEADAQHLVKRPLAKAYLADNTLTLIEPKAYTKADTKADAKKLTGSASTGDAAADPVPAQGSNATD